MQKAGVLWGYAAVAAGLTLIAASQLKAAETAGVRTVAEELDKRSKPAEATAGTQDKLSDRSVNVMSSFAFSILPEQYPGPDGKTAKLDKSDPNKFLLPVDDARRIIRIATRSAYAAACGLPDYETLNFNTMMQGEAGRKWSTEQTIFIKFLYVFAVSYFTGDMKITEQPDDGANPPAGSDQAKAPQAPAAQDAPQASANAANGAPDAFVPKKLTCTPEQKEKVSKAIAAYAQSAKAAAPQAPAAPAAAPQVAKPALPAAPANSAAPN